MYPALFSTMLRKLLLGLLYKTVLSMPEILLKDPNQRRRRKAKDIMFNPEQSRFDDSDVDRTK